MFKKKNWPAARTVVLSLALLVSTLAIAQNPPIPDASQGRDRHDPNSGAPINPDAEKHIMEENDKDVKKKVQKLYDLVTELKAESDKTDSSKVLNLMLVKKAEEIEKLAHDIKTRSKAE
jgi:hypothetical protein